MSFDVEILKQIPILNIADRLGIRVRKNKAMCFRGHDTVPSLSFSPQKNLWHCFGCDLGGNNIALVKAYYGYTFKEAAAWLSEQFNLSSKPYSSGHSIFSKKKIDSMKIVNNQKQYLDVDSEVYEAFFSKCSLSQKGKEYLESRQYKLKIINQFKIKDIINIAEVEKWLLKSFDRNRLLKSGLMVTRRGNLRLIWWDHTILFPFIKDNRIVYIQGRRLSTNPPKYMGLAGIVKPLYNQDILIDFDIGGTVYICEGITDTLAASQLGCAAIGVLGAASFKKSWVDDLMKFRIIVIPDCDSAGKMFAEKIKEAFLEKDHIVEILRLSGVKDLSELLSVPKQNAHH